MNSVLLLLLLTSFLFTQTHAHGLMIDPAQRGTLNPANKFSNSNINKSAPIDYKAHFPAGDKDADPGAGARSQIRAVPNWTVFTPTKKSFRWRAGVCGDEIGKPQEHLRGGKYYGIGQIVKTWTQGSVIEVKVNIIAHHNGFIELHLCDVAKCGGEISPKCFKEGHCYHLKRAPNPSCDSGYDKRCAPIDPHYPHRWYLPCTTKPENVHPNIMGGAKMKYKLPDQLSCEHCVLHWFWTAANTCNPPGVIEFFEGENGPKNWGQCFGQGGARGGYTKVQRDCGPSRFPEEYYQCADVKVLPRGSTTGWNPSSTTAPPTTRPSTTSLTSGTSTQGPKVKQAGPSVLREFVLYGDGKRIRGLPDDTVVDITEFKQVAIEAVTSRVVSNVLFFVDGDLLWTDYYRPYFMFGNQAGPIPWGWDNPIVNRFFRIRSVADGDEMESRIMFVKR